MQNVSNMFSSSRKFAYNLSWYFLLLHFKKYIVNRFEGDKILTFLPSCLETIFVFYRRQVDYFFFSFNQFSSGSVVMFFGAESVVCLISTQNKNFV